VGHIEETRAVRVVLINTESLIHHDLVGSTDLQQIPLQEDARNGLICALRTIPDATLILDSEIKVNEQARYQNLEGLQIAYELRIHPEIRFRGFIKLHGFMPLMRIREHRFGGLLRGGERIHAKEFALNGVSYSQYPAVDLQAEPPLTLSQWFGVVKELDEIFVQEFRRFEHGFRNVTMFRGMSNGARAEKKEELQSHLRMLTHIEMATIVQPGYQTALSDIKKALREVVSSVNEEDEDRTMSIFRTLKRDVDVLRKRLTEERQSL
jgi:hypothetical protein